MYYCLVLASPALLEFRSDVPKTSSPPLPHVANCGKSCLDTLFQTMNMQSNSVTLALEQVLFGIPSDDHPLPDLHLLKPEVRRRRNACGSRQLPIVHEVLTILSMRCLKRRKQEKEETVHLAPFLRLRQVEAL